MISQDPGCEKTLSGETLIKVEYNRYNSYDEFAREWACIYTRTYFWKSIWLDGFEPSDKICSINKICYSDFLIRLILRLNSWLSNSEIEKTDKQQKGNVSFIFDRTIVVFQVGGGE